MLGFLCWLIAGYGGSLEISGSSLTVVAAMTAAVTTALRWPLLQSGIGDIGGTWCWQLCYLAAINWAGGLVLAGTGWLDALPVLVILGLTELGVHQKALQKRSAEMLGATNPEPSLANSPLDAGSLLGVSGNPTPNTTADPQQEAGHEERRLDEQLDGRFDRRLVDAHDVDGIRFVEGEVQLMLADQQTSEEVVIGFCPPFVGHPEVDFEPDHESLSVRLVRCTPSGMRLKVSRGAAAGTQEVMLQWYARQTDADSEATAGLQTSLP